MSRLSVFGRRTQNLEDTLLVLLDFLHRRGLSRISESDLHRLIFSINPMLPIPLKFIQRPLTYSNDVFDSLKRLERSRLVDELVYVHDGWVPRHLYEVTRVGHLRAAELEDRIRAGHAFPLERVLHELVVAAKSRQLLHE